MLNKKFLVATLSFITLTLSQTAFASSQYNTHLSIDPHPNTAGAIESVVLENFLPGSSSVNSVSVYNPQSDFLMSLGLKDSVVWLIDRQAVSTVLSGGIKENSNHTLQFSEQTGSCVTVNYSSVKGAINKTLCGQQVSLPYPANNAKINLKFSLK